MEKVSLAELKKLIKHFKAHECPRLGQKKEVLMKFAVEHKLIAHKEEAKELAIEKHKKMPEVVKAEVVKAEVVVPAKEKKVIKVKKESMEAVKSPLEKAKARLQAVQKIRKEKGVSLKEAWAMLKN